MNGKWSSGGHGTPTKTTQPTKVFETKRTKNENVKKAKNTRIIIIKKSIVIILMKGSRYLLGGLSFPLS